MQRQVFNNNSKQNVHASGYTDLIIGLAEANCYAINEFPILDISHTFIYVHGAHMQSLLNIVKIPL